MKKIIMLAVLYMASSSILGMQSNNQSFDQWQAQRRAEEQRRMGQQIQQARVSNQHIPNHIIHNASPAAASQANAHNAFVKKQ